MFDVVLDALEDEWELMGIGFKLEKSMEALRNVTWVDNTFIIGADMGQCELVIRALTLRSRDRYGWQWKPSSLEFTANNTYCPVDFC